MPSGTDWGGLFRRPGIVAGVTAKSIVLRRSNLVKMVFSDLQRVARRRYAASLNLTVAGAGFFDAGAADRPEEGSSTAGAVAPTTGKVPAAGKVAGWAPSELEPREMDGFVAEARQALLHQSSVPAGLPLRTSMLVLYEDLQVQHPGRLHSRRQ